ncbi:BglG family transcription antiterminator [Alteribacillus bidgolensis]|uniref:Transcriptional antiterminator, BglG family n=1 Tax=Alteribacillus bidgolensis TaxID=930129 RepID=A0A1G8FUZ0_9BACI|nr:BglG family transcription antiterminator [Alteribacillus bidgolensis]SDH85959.1 transcriptional antiterminator, BglG family [Alteribacillus bidgolensis]
MVLDKRRTFILNQMYHNNGIVNMKLLKNKLGVSQRTIYYDLDQINCWLECKGLKPIQKARGKGFYLTVDTCKELPSRLTLKNQWEYRFSQKERIQIILLMLVTRSTSLQELMDTTQVSRGTMFRDLKKASKELEYFEMKLTYEKRSGYQIIGQEQKKHQLMSNVISYILTAKDSPHLNEKLHDILYPSSNNNDDRLKPFLKKELASIEKTLNVSFTENVIQYLVLQIMIAIKQKNRSVSHEIDKEEIQILQKTKAYQSIEKLNDSLQEQEFGSIPSHEMLLLTMQLLGSRVHHEHITGTCTKEMSQLQMVVKKIIDDFQLIGCLIFADRKQLEENLFTHLKPAFYRLKYDISTNNHYLEEIQKHYPDVFYLTKRSLSHLESFIGKDIPDEEAAYIAMHFGGWLRRENQNTAKKYKAMVVCENGIAASGMLRSQLETLLPDIMILHTVSIREYNQSDYQVDIVFSTSYIKQKQAPVIYVPALLIDKDRENIVHQVKTILESINPVDQEVSLLMAMIEEHATIHQPGVLKEKLAQCIGNQYSLTKETYKPMLDELLTQDMIQLEEAVTSWEEAIRVSAAPLLKNESINQRYVEAMIHNVYENGPYVVISPNIAIPHARPEQGVNRLGMSFLRLKKPVAFSDQAKHQASLVIVLAAIDNETHLKALSQLTEMLSEPGNTDRLIQSADADDILAIVKQYSLN